MEEWIPLVLFILLMLGGTLLKRYVEKQQAQKNAAGRQTQHAARKPTATTSTGDRPVFHDRAAERRIQARAQEPMLPERSIAAPQPGAGRPPTPAAPGRQVPPGAAVARQATRQKVERRGMPARAARGRARAEEKHEPAPVAQLEQRRLASLKVGEVSALRGRTLRPAAERPAVAPRPASGFLGNMLRGKQLSRAIVLSEILGPPKGLRDL